MKNPERILPQLFRWSSGLSGKQHPLNSYAWSAGSEIVLIDPAADVTPAAMTAAGLGRVTRIWVTHVQEENIAGCLNFPGPPVHVPAGDEYLCDGPEAYRALITKWPDPWPWETLGNYHGHLGGAMNERPAPAKISLAESLHEIVGDAPLQPDGTARHPHPNFRIPSPVPFEAGGEGQGEGGALAGVNLQAVLPTPGHGKHAITIIARIDGKRVAFCGDLIYGDGQLWNWFDSEWDYGAQVGARALRQSVERLQQANVDLLCPTHGPVIHDPASALDQLARRLDAVLKSTPPLHSGPINFPEVDSPAPGFRQILPQLHQWRDGNCNVLISASGNALLVDDGLCYWKPLAERARHHRQVIDDLKAALNIKRIEIVIPTHFHGDHTENIPELVAGEGTDVVCLDLVAEAIEHPERFNLACQLPWYGTAHDTVPIHRRLKSGERFRWHEFELEIFHLGGQTHYHLGIAALIGSQRVLFVGDAFFCAAPLVGAVLCYNKADPATAGWAYATERMIERNPDLLVCGHGSAMRDPMPRLEQQRAAWRSRIAEYRTLSARPDLRDFFDPFLG